MRNPFPDGQRRHHLLFATWMTGSCTIYRWGWQFTGSEGFDEAYVPFLGAAGAAWDDAMVARRSASPLGTLWPEWMRRSSRRVVAARRPPAAARRPLIVIALLEAGAPRDIREIRQRLVTDSYFDRSRRSPSMRTISDLPSLGASVNSRRVDSLGCRRHVRLNCHPLRASARDRIQGRLIPLGDPGQLWKGAPCHTAGPPERGASTNSD